MRKTRFIEDCRCYHLISRLEHQAFFLDDNEKTRAVELLRRVKKRGEGPHCIRTDRWKMMAAVVLPALAAGRDWASPGWTYLWGHGPHDVYTYELAVRFSKVKDYYSVRPSW